MKKLALVSIILLAAMMFGMFGAAIAEGTPVTFRLSYYADPKGDAVIKQIIADFMEKNPGITVDVFSSDWQGHYDKLKPELAAGEGPAMFLLDGVNLLEYADRGSIEDLTDRMTDVDFSKYYVFNAIESPNGRIFGVPQTAQIDVLYYNKDMFDAAGVAYPTSDWSLNDLKAAAEQLNNPGSYWAANFPVHVRFTWYPLVRAFGGDVLDATRTQSTIVSDPKVKEAMEYIKSFWDEGLTPNFVDMQGELTAASNTYFPRAKVAMFYNNLSTISLANQEGLNYDVVITPKGPDGDRFSSIIANCWVINNKAPAEQKDAAWKFIEYYISDEVQNLIAADGTYLPINKASQEEIWLKNELPPANRQAFVDSFENAGTLGENAVWSEWTAAFNTQMKDYLSGTLSIDDFLAKADVDVQAVLDSFYKK